MLSLRITLIAIVINILVNLSGCTPESGKNVITLPAASPPNVSSKKIDFGDFKSVDKILGTFELKRGFGHFVFSMDNADHVNFVATSLEQPDAKVVKISDGQFALINLFPQKHTILISREINSQKQIAALRDVEIESEGYVDAGIVAFEKPGVIQGRFLDSTSSLPMANVDVKINLLGLSVASDSGGRFEFSNLPAGRWLLSGVTADGAYYPGTWIDVESGGIINIGDMWIGHHLDTFSPAVLINGQNGITSSSKLLIKAKLPQGARFLSVRAKDGTVLRPRFAATETFEVELLTSLKTTLEIFVWDDDSKILGVLSLPVEYDPFVSGGKVFIPKFKVTQRVIASPNRVLSIEVNDIPQNAISMRFAINDVWGEWQEVTHLLTLELPKSNATCGQNVISIQFKNQVGHVSQTSGLPVTLSCWQRIAHRAAVEKVVGLDNAATWTGTHAFVWSGRQQSVQSDVKTIGGPNTSESVQSLELIQRYNYFDGGYVFKPKANLSDSFPLSEVEFIVTDNAPAPRSLSGVNGRNHLVAVYGGENAKGPISDGAIYDINSNGWVTMMGPGAPSPRIKPVVYFLSETKILVWGGRTRTNLGYEIALSDGAIYDIDIHSWSPISTVQAPSPRIDPEVIWTGTELFVIGGRIPGSVNAKAVQTSAKYTPATDTWSSIPTPIEDVIFMSSIYVDGHIIIYGHNNELQIFRVSDNTITYKKKYDKPLYNIEPNLVLASRSSEGDPDLLYIFGGKGSYLGTDVNDKVLVLPYKNGVIDESDDRQTEDNLAWVAPTVGSLSSGSCCLESLAFSVNEHVFAINSTIVNYLSVYTYDQDVLSASSSDNSVARAFVREKGNSGIVFRYHETALDVLSFRRLDLGPDWSSPGSEPNGPYSLFYTDPPVWSEQKRSLIWYGGIYLDPHNRRDLQGGWIYHLDDKVWTKISPAGIEPTFLDGFGETRSYSRLLHMNFFLGDSFFSLGGYHPTSRSTAFTFEGYESIGVGASFLYNGLKTSFLGNTPNPTVEVLGSPSENFDFVPLGHNHSFYRMDVNAPCILGDAVLLPGGRRFTERNVSGIDNTHALVQDKVIFDGITSSMRRVPVGPLGVRAGMTVVSAGTHCYMWGGYRADDALFSPDVSQTTKSILSRYSPQGSGALFSPSTDLWTEISSLGAPSERSFMHGVWTGSEILMWGGRRDFLPKMSKVAESDRGIWFYSPSKDSWSYLPPSSEEPRFTGKEKLIWTGNNLLVWTAENSDFNFQFNPGMNSWSRLNLPYGFGYRSNSYFDSHAVWAGEKLLVMPIANDGLGLMAFYVPPDP